MHGGHASGAAWKDGTEEGGGGVSSAGRGAGKARQLACKGICMTTPASNRPVTRERTPHAHGNFYIRQAYMGVEGELPADVTSFGCLPSILLDPHAPVRLFWRV